MHAVCETTETDAVRQKERSGQTDRETKRHRETQRDTEGGREGGRESVCVCERERVGAVRVILSVYINTKQSIKVVLWYLRMRHEGCQRIDGETNGIA